MQAPEATQRAARKRASAISPPRGGAGEPTQGSPLQAWQRGVGNRAVGRVLRAGWTAGPSPPGGRLAEGGGAAPATVGEVLRASGEPLDARARAFMERRFGHDFGGVRIHTGPAAVRSARAMSAVAYTVGRHIAFDQGRYRPGTRAGSHLLAHELAHVVQQSGAPPAAAAGLAVEPADGHLERQAEGAADRLARGERVRLPGGAAKLARQRIQRQEAGTYVSTHGDQNFLDAAARFYRNWHHPNVRRVATIDDVVRDLDRRRGALHTFRIVAHANPGELLIGLLPSLAPSSIDRTALEFGTAQRFRTRLTQTELIDDATFGRIVSILGADALTAPFMATLGVGATAPATDSPMGIMLRAIFEAHFLDAVQLDTGGPVVFQDRAVLDEFNRRRRVAYQQVVVGGFPAADRAGVRQAIADLIANLPAALGRAGFSFGTMTQAEADQFADRVKEPNPAGGQRLQPEIATLISEGAARGPFLRRLGRVRARISAATHIEIRGCQIGQNPDFLDDFRGFMGRAGDLPSISAPDLFQYFFPLNFETLPATAVGDADLAAAFADPLSGLERDFVLQHRVRQGELIQVAIEESPADFINRYGLAARGIDAAALRRLNPEIRDWTILAEGTDVFLKARQIPAGSSANIGDFASRVFGDFFKWPKVWSFNPHIRQPDLQPNDLLWLQSSADRARFGVVSAAPGLTELRAAIRGGQAVVSIEETASGDTAPRLRLDDPQRAAAIGRWLASQRFDPRGRPAQVLSRLFARNFRATTMRLHMQFLSRSFPNIEDPIFPDDPRFNAHIIRR